VQGIGQAFTEHLVYDERSGQLLSGSLMDYGLPRADEVSSFEMDENPVPTKTNPWASRARARPAMSARSPPS
jgi:aerobic carbon-monoxide dehydrogenase large subunit